MSGRRGGRGGGGGGPRGGNTGPAIMLMPPSIRATFMPNPPLPHIVPIRQRRKHAITGIMPHLAQITAQLQKEATASAKETTSHEKENANDDNNDDDPKKKKEEPLKKRNAIAAIRDERKRQRLEKHQRDLTPRVEAYRKEQSEYGGEFDGMNCYNTLFVGRLAYEVTERKLLREMEAFGPVKDLRIIQDQKKTNKSDAAAAADNHKSRGYAFVEYEHEEDMKRAYRGADGMRLEGRAIVVDVERGHTVPSWLPRRLGGGLGGTRLGGPHQNYARPGRFDPHKPPGAPPQPPAVPPGDLHGPPPHHGGGGGPMGRGGGPMGRGGPPPPSRMGGGGGFYRRDGPGGGPPPPPPPGRYGGGPRYDDRYNDDRGPPPRYDDRGPPRYDDRDDRKRRRGDSPPPMDHRYGGGGGGRNRRF